MNPESGGAERVSQAYLGALVERGHEVWWFANEFPGGERAETLRGMKIVRGGGKGTSIVKAIRWYRQQPRFDLVMDQHHGIPWYTPWWCGTNHIAYIHEVLGRLPKDIAILIIEHDMDVIFRFAREIIVLVQGRVLTRGEPAMIAANPEVRAVYLGRTVV